MENKTLEIIFLRKALTAIEARIMGRFDDPSLMQIGSLSSSIEGDILDIIEKTFKSVS